MRAKNDFVRRASGSFARLAFALILSSVLASAACTTTQTATSVRSAQAPIDLSSICTPAALQALSSRMQTTRVTIGRIANGPVFADGVSYVAAADGAPAYCQITGNYVTNPATGKTANFLATLPANWSGRYLQLGCSGHCGQFYVSDAATPSITVTNQGRPGDIIARGYASFATDEGHEGMSGGAWAIGADGAVNQDALDDFLIRAQRVLSNMGKEFTTAFYEAARGTRAGISYAYFSGCSGGGRDALVAASYFPEQFDGIIAGSPYSNLATGAFHTGGATLAHIRADDADVTPAQMSQVDALVMAQCDDVDGVRDGLIQNPAACNFRPERDLPRCEDGQSRQACFSAAQIATVSAYITAATDEQGALVHTGFSVSNIQASMRMTPAPIDRNAIEPWPNAASASSGPVGGLWGLGDAVIRIFSHRNEPNFHFRSVLSLRDGGPGETTFYRTVAPRVEVDRASAALRMGIGAIPEQAERLISTDRKLLIWHNLSDQLLTPYMSTNYYNELARLHGGYERLHRNVRLFDLPGTIHCSMGGVGPNSFDALGAMEAWVERGQAPNALLVSQYASRQDPNIPQLTHIDYNAPPTRTMPLCMYPQMARYRGAGDVNDAANWSCERDDRRMLTLGESGRRAGVRGGS